MPIKVLELFSGYGGASFALTKAKIEHKVIGYSDINKPANYIYALNHGKDILQLGDVTTIDTNKLEDFDLLTAGFSCQPFSIAGARMGFADKKNGNMFFEIIRIAETKKPPIMLLENVEGIISHDNGNTMKTILLELKKIGYYVKYKKLYSKDYGTPQNRPRIWFVCFRDWDKYIKFIFPDKEKLTLKIKDLLDDNVDKKYNRTKEHVNKIKNCSFCTTVRSIINLQDKYIYTIITHKSPVFDDLLRKVTPKECFRFMGFFDDEINFGNLKDNQLYILAGNGWDINVASKIFQCIYVPEKVNRKTKPYFI